MDIKLEKYKLMEWLLSIEDESMISEIKELKTKHNSSSQWDRSVSEAEKLFIEAGLKDIEDGNTKSHEDVMREVREIYGLK